jgi:hypothetical protein
MSHAIIILFRLSTFEYPAYLPSKNKVLEVIDFGEALLELAKCWESLPLNKFFARKFVTEGFAKGEIEPQIRAEWEGINSDEGELTSAGTVLEHIAKIWKKKIKPRLIAGDHSAAEVTQGGLGNRGDINMAGPDDQQQNQTLNHNQSLDGLPDAIDWELPEDWWMSELLGDKGQDFFFSF